MRSQTISPEIFTGMTLLKQEQYITGSKEFTMESIIRSVCSFLNISEDVLVSPQRKFHIKEARHIAVYLIRTNVVGITLQEIAHKFNRDHSTILSSIHVVEDGIRFDRAYRKKIETIKQNL